MVQGVLEEVVEEDHHLQLAVEGGLPPQEHLTVVEELGERQQGEAAVDHSSQVEVEVAAAAVELPHVHVAVDSAEPVTGCSQDGVQEQKVPQKEDPEVEVVGWFLHAEDVTILLGKGLA